MIEHISFGSNGLTLLDQRLLPAECHHICCRNYSEAIQAIKNMAVRGAPAIGIAAAYACCLACQEQTGKQGWREALDKALDEIEHARPTAVNLSWAVKRMRDVWRKNSFETPEHLCRLWQNLAREIHTHDLEVCRRIGEAGESLLKDGDTVLTHCNAGALATSGIGTALAPVRLAIMAGKKIRVIADETRPLLQGARLTAWELAEDNIPVMVACDNACAILMSRGLVQVVITGADRIAMNGDTANKTGTCGVAIMARYYNLPFYIAAPLSTFDPQTKSGQDIPIEERAENEVSQIGNVSIMPSGVHAYNFAFDVTPAELITGIITEAGILRPPYSQSIATALAGEAGL